MKLLVTRPSADAAPLARALEARGHTVLLDPTIEIRPLPDVSPDLMDIASLLFTSANGVRSFTALSDRRDLPVYTVGSHTAAAARDAGFGSVQNADGDGEALVAFVKSHRRPEDGAILHVTGVAQARDVAAELREAGFDARKQAIYEAVPAAAFADTTRAAMQAGEIDGILLFSPQTADRFCQLLVEAGLAGQADRLDAYCLSPAVAQALTSHGFRQIQIAAAPNEPALVALIADPAVVEAAPIASTKIFATGAPVVSRQAGFPYGVVAIALLIIACGVSSYWWLPIVRPYFHRPHIVASTDIQPERAIVPAPVTDTPAVAAPPAAAAAADALKARIDRLDEAVNAIQEATANAPSKADLDGVRDDITNLTRRVEALHDAVDPHQLAGLGDSVKQLGAALASLQAQQSSGQSDTRRDTVLALAAAQVSSAIAHSAPYDASVRLLQAVAGTDATLAGPVAVLQAHASTGVASRLQLVQQLNALPPRFDADAAPTDGGGIGFWSRLKARFLSLVRVSRVDEAAAASGGMPSPAKTVAAARANLYDGDLAAAIKTMQQITGTPAEIAKPWLATAAESLAAEQAATQLEAVATRRIAGAPANGSASQGESPP